MLPSWIKGFLAYCNETVAPIHYLEWSAAHAIAAALQRKAWVTYNGERLYSNLFILLVGPPRIGKSTAIKRVRRPMEKVKDIKIAADSVTKEQLYVAMEKVSNSLAHVDLPSIPGLYNHASYNITNTEFGVMLSKEDKQFMLALCKMYDCEDTFRHEIKTGDSSHIENVFLNMIGAATLVGLRDILPEAAFQTGFAARLNLVYASEKRGAHKPTLGEDPEEKMTEDSGDAELSKALRRDLNSVHKLSGPFAFAPEARAAFFSWLESGMHPKVTHMQFASYNDARDIHLLKLAMVHSAAVSNDMIITMQNFLDAKDMLERNEALMPQAITYVGANEQQAYIEEALRFIATEYVRRGMKPVPAYLVRQQISPRIPVQFIRYVMNEIGYQGLAEIIGEPPHHAFKPKSALVLEAEHKETGGGQ